MSPSTPPPREDPDPALGRVIQGLREQRGMARADLASRAGVDEAFLARIEAGTSDPPWATVEALAAGLGVSVEGIATAVIAQDRDTP